MDDDDWKWEKENVEIDCERQPFLNTCKVGCSSQLLRRKKKERELLLSRV